MKKKQDNILITVQELQHKLEEELDSLKKHYESITSNMASIFSEEDEQYIAQIERKSTEIRGDKRELKLEQQKE